MAAPVFGASDVLALGSGWEPFESSGSGSQQRATATGDDGDIVAESAFDAQQIGQVSYHYTGAEVAFIAAFAAATCWPGYLKESKLFILGVGIDYNPCAQGELPVVTFDVTNGPVTAAPTPFWYTTALVLPTYTAANIIIPTLLSVTAGDAECNSCQWGIRCNHGRTLNKDGAYLAGRGYGGEETLNLSFVGVPTSITSTGWINTALAPADIALRSNTGYPSVSYSFTRKVARQTA
jgi:hypothetical protein